MEFVCRVIFPPKFTPDEYVLLTVTSPKVADGISSDDEPLNSMILLSSRVKIAKPVISVPPVFSVALGSILRVRLSSLMLPPPESRICDVEDKERIPWRTYKIPFVKNRSWEPLVVETVTGEPLVLLTVNLKTLTVPSMLTSVAPDPLITRLPAVLLPLSIVAPPEMVRSP